MLEKSTPKRLSRTEKRQLTRRQLLESAQKMFSAKGFEGVSVEEIAEHAGYSRGAFYSNFSSTTDVLKALIDEGFEGDLSALNMLRGVTSLEELADGFVRIAESFYENPASLLWTKEFQLAVIRHPELAHNYSTQYQKVRDSAADIIELYFAHSSHPSPQKTRAYCDVFLVTLTGLCTTAVIHKDSFDKAMIRQAFLTLISGIGQYVEQGKLESK